MSRDLDAALRGKKHLILVLLVLFSMPILLLTFCANLAHQQQAAGVLKMEDCLNCHSGAGDKAISVCVGSECLYKKNHSMMSLYPPHGKERDYAPRAVIESAGCILEDGKITCLSCHDLTQPPPHVIRPGDQLCRICHLNA